GSGVIGPKVYRRPRFGEQIPCVIKSRFLSNRAGFAWFGAAGLAGSAANFMETTAKTGFLAWWHRTPLYLRILGGIILGVLTGVVLGPAAGSLAIPSRLVLRLLGALAPTLILLAITRALMTATFEKGTTGKLLGL